MINLNFDLSIKNNDLTIFCSNSLNLFADEEDVIIYVPSSMEWEKVFIENFIV